MQRKTLGGYKYEEYIRIRSLREQLPPWLLFENPEKVTLLSNAAFVMALNHVHVESMPLRVYLPSRERHAVEAVGNFMAEAMRLIENHASLIAELKSCFPMPAWVRQNYDQGTNHRWLFRSSMSDPMGLEKEREGAYHTIGTAPFDADLNKLDLEYAFYSSLLAFIFSNYNVNPLARMEGFLTPGLPVDQTVHVYGSYGGYLLAKFSKGQMASMIRMPIGSPDQSRIFGALKYDLERAQRLGEDINEVYQAVAAIYGEAAHMELGLSSLAFWEALADPVMIEQIQRRQPVDPQRIWTFFQSRPLAPLMAQYRPISREREAYWYHDILPGVGVLPAQGKTGHIVCFDGNHRESLAWATAWNQKFPDDIMLVNGKVLPEGVFKFDIFQGLDGRLLLLDDCFTCTLHLESKSLTTFANTSGLFDKIEWERGVCTWYAKQKLAYSRSKHAYRVEFNGMEVGIDPV